MATELCEIPVNFLVANDDEDDKMLIGEAVEAECDCYNLKFVSDGEELLDYLQRSGRYSSAELSPYPDLILLDLNMPKKDGLSVLREIKSDPDFQLIPLVMFTSTGEEETVARSYDTGADVYINKPTTFEGLTRVIRCLSAYWCRAATLPSETRIMECARRFDRLSAVARESGAQSGDDDQTPPF